MKHSLFSVITVLILFTSQFVSAQTISEATAQSRAEAFFATQATNAPGRGNSVPSASLTLAYTSVKDGHTCFYVYNRGENDGYVIMGGDEQAKEILAYVPQGHFVYDSLPDNMKWWLGQYEQEISAATQTTIQRTETSRRVAQSNEVNSYRNLFTDIPDMVTTQWGQGQYYNNAIPLMGEEHPQTGCVATALAQIMKYWNYPSVGTGSIANGEYSVNFAEATYEWANMLDSYDSESTSSEVDAVSQLMYHVGASLGYQYQYGVYETAYIEWYGYKSAIQQSLHDYFGYSDEMTYLMRDGVCDEDWECIIYSELSAGRPVFYAGTSNLGGHAFVCHGYSSSLGLFAFNWGWNGFEDGYYALSSTNGVNGFTKQQWILTGFEPTGRQHQLPVEFGDKFSENGNHYIVFNPYLKRVALSTNVVGTESTYSGDIVIPSTVDFLGDRYEVTHIGQFAFSNGSYNFNIRSVNLPNSILSLGASAFYGAYYVNKIELPSNIQKIGTTCFSSCSNLDSITIPEGVTVINENCFNGCHALKSVNLHNNITSLGFGCFANCESLKELTIPEGITFLDRIIYGDNSLLKITLPSSIESLEYECFAACSNLSYLYCHSVNVPQVLSTTFPENIGHGVLFVPQSSIETYSNAAFWKNWGSIEAIETAEETNHLGESFEINGIRYSVRANGVIVEKCITRQQEIVIPQQVEYKGEQFPVLQIGTYAFLNHDDNDILESVVLPEGIKVIADGAFTNCFHLKHINLPESLIEIGNSACACCWELDDVLIPSSINTIKSGTFDGCISLERLHIGHGVQIIKSNAFYGCRSLSKVVIPSSVILLYGESFGNCPNLTEMYSFSPMIYSWQEWKDVFQPDVWTYDTGTPIASNQANATLYVPNEYISNYVGYSIWQNWGNILPMVPLSGLLLGENLLELEIGANHTLELSVSPVNASVPDCIWTSSDPTIASVNADGVVTAHQAGTATITATSMYYPDLSDSCIVTVTPAMYQISFLNDDGTILQQDSVDYGQIPAYNGVIPSKEGTAQYTYTFAGWTPEVVAVTSDATYTATYSSTVNQYTITVSGENCTTTGDGTYDYGTEVTLTVTPDEGYRFIEWSDGVPEAIRQIIVIEDATYIAHTEMQSIETGQQENSLSEQVQKIFDGTNYYILRGGKRYTMQGQEVK